jgi:hypothetical protein
MQARKELAKSMEAIVEIVCSHDDENRIPIENCREGSDCMQNECLIRKTRPYTRHEEPYTRVSY